MLKRALKAAILDGSAYEGVHDEPQPLIGAMAVVGVDGYRLWPRRAKPAARR